MILLYLLTLEVLVLLKSARDLIFIYENSKVHFLLLVGSSR